jgi:hypothetical protein
MKFRTSRIHARLFLLASLWSAAAFAQTPTPAYTDIVDASVFVGADVITASITVADLPATLPVNQASTPDSYGEYAWEVLFDNDGSGRGWTIGDVLFYFNHYKVPGAAPADLPVNTSFGQCPLLDVRESSTASGGVAGYHVADLCPYMTVNGDTISFSVPRSTHESLAGITPNTAVVFRAFSRGTDGTYYNDYFPESGTNPVIVSDTSPDAFSFAAVTDVASGAVIESGVVVVSGITAAAPIAISGGEYSINGGAWTTATGTVALGNQVKVRLTAPATYGAEGSATLTIGDVSASFTVTTRAFTRVAAVTEVFSNAGTTATVVDGIVQINAAPTQPLAIPSNATVNAVVALNTSAPVQVLSGTNTLDIVRQETDTVMQVVTVGSTPALIPIAGSVSIGAPQGNTSIPVAGGTTGSATVVTSTANTTVVTGPSTTTVGNRVVAVSSGGPVRYSTLTTSRAPRASGTLPTYFDVYPGEAVLADDSGAAGQVRLGSFAQDGSQAGDYLANLPRAASTLQVPRVAGSSERFNGQEWTLLVGQAIAAKLGLGTATSLTQDATTGVMTLVTSNGTYRFLPVGTLALADAALNGGSRAVSVAAIAANLTAILDSSLSFAVAPATAYADLEQALKRLSSTASLEVLGDGVIKASLSGTDYIAQPAAQATDGSTAGCPGFVTENNQLALCDAAGRRQVLNAAFADTDTLISTFEADLGDLSVSNAGSSGRYALLYQGMGFSLYPDIVLATPPSAQAGRLWWLDSASGKIYIRYPNGTAQGFSLQ